MSTLLDTLIADLAEEAKRYARAVSAKDRRQRLAGAAVMFVACAAIDLGENPAAMRDLELRLLAAIASVGSAKRRRVSLALDRALARQSYDALAAQLARRWKPKPPDKRRTARSLAAEIRKLAAGNATWFQRRPEAARVLAHILGSTPKKLGLVPFEIQSRDLGREGRGWSTHATRATLKAAEDLAWSLLTRHGGDWRVRQGDRTIASGAGYRPGEPRFSHDRTATWARVQKKHA